ncbi:MAG: NAD(P)-dependent oxidoreductase [Acidobacteria bacterium]|nr:NAD(P)-dependent oxidoreductase [Acidobacteriota bacterium]
MKETIGFVGTGNMGLPMAENLVRAGYRLRVYNRTPGKAGPLVALGAEQVSTIRALAESGGVVVSMISDDAALEQIASSGMIQSLAPGGVHVSMSTVSPAAAREAAGGHRSLGVDYVAAPVFGRPEAAAARRLWICVSRPSAAKERVRPMLSALGQETFDFGEDPGAANVVKLVGNFLLGSAVEAMAEAFALAEKNGLKASQVIEMLSRTLFACPVYQTYGRLLVERKYEPAGFRLALALKDIRLVVATADASATPMPLASLLHGRMISGAAKGRADLDWSVIGLAAREDAAL